MKEKIEYIKRCIDTIQADKNISATTISIMFREYEMLIKTEMYKEFNQKIQQLKKNKEI